MDSLITAVGFFVYFLALTYSVNVAAEGESKTHMLLSAALIIYGLWFVIELEKKEEAKGPCLKEEVQMIWNGNAMIPYKVCTLRGEWVKP